MKLAFVIPGAGGGGGRVIMEFAKGLANRGHEVRILHPQSSGSARSRARSLYLQLRYGNRGRWWDSFPGPIIPFQSLTEQAAEVEKLSHSLEEIIDSRAWKLVVALRKLSASLFPSGSIQEKFAQLLLKPLPDVFRKRGEKR